MKKKFKDTKFAKIAGGIIREGLQTLPIVGTVVTNMKENTPENPEGKIKLGRNEWFRIVLGVGLAYLIYKGLLTIEFLDLVKEAVNSVG
jgi:hypothetical protein